jgi:IS5 family transposase
LVEAHKHHLRNGRGAVGVDRMLRIYFLQLWFTLSDSEVEDALRESWAMRHFVGVDIPEERLPDENAIASFRDLLEKHDLGEEIRARLSRQFQEHCMRINPGYIVDASILRPGAPVKDKE